MLFLKKAPTASLVVWRTPAASPDKTQANLNQTAAWYDIDLSAIVPAKATAIIFVVQGVMNAAGNMIQFRKNGDATTSNKAQLQAEANTRWNSVQLTVECDTGRTIEYSQTTIWDQLNLTVQGWIIPSDA